jgi:hypothetical protein
MTDNLYKITKNEYQLLHRLFIYVQMINNSKEFDVKELYSEEATQYVKVQP